MSTSTQSSAKGKLTNKDSGEALAFSLNPTEIKLSRGFDFSVEPVLARSAPVVAFKSGAAATLAFQLKFDSDVDDKWKAADALKFLQGLNKVKADTRSAATVEFTLGSFSFTGYVQSFSLLGNRFDKEGNLVGATLDFALISNGEYESAGA